MKGLKVDMDERGVRYEAERGYGLPMHEHPSYSQTHNVKCLEGQIMLFFDNSFDVLNPGDETPPLEIHVRHGIAVLSDRAVWYNDYGDNGPPGYAQTPEEQRSTVLDSPCDAPRRFLTQLGG